MARKGILKPVPPREVNNASPVVWQRKKIGELRLYVDFKVHINGKVMDEDYPIPDMETIFHNLHGASYVGRIDLLDAYYQIQLDGEANDICTINTSQGLFKMCRLPHGLKNSSSIFQKCIESTLKGIKGVAIFKKVCWCMELSRNSSMKESLPSRVDYVRNILLLMIKVLFKTSQ